LPAIASSRLPRDLSPWSMFLTADIVVQAVIVGLVFASMVTWTVWFAKSIELYRAHRRLTRGLTAISAYRSLSEVFTRLGDNSDLF
jgi:biopolymer transport protein ExbB